jgi:type II secretory ATPase GspE/PulE/Tfp pilus assembly ATPase PilB-like protein
VLSSVHTVDAATAVTRGVDARVERPLTRARTAAIAGQNLLDRTHVEATGLLL